MDTSSSLCTSSSTSSLSSSDSKSSSAVGTGKLARAAGLLIVGRGWKAGLAQMNCPQGLAMDCSALAALPILQKSGGRQVPVAGGRRLRLVCCTQAAGSWWSRANVLRALLQPGL